jgi:EmrB/QacA subfamily drug resistance transporter
MARNVSETRSTGGPAGGAPVYVPLDLSQSARKLVIAGTLLGLLVAAINQTTVSTALPRIVGDLGGLHLFSWVFTSYMLTSTTTVPLAGKLSDIFGRKPFFLGGILIMLVTSIGAGTSGSIEQLIGWRLVQGLGAGMIMGNAFAIIGDLFPPAERGKYQGLFTGVFGVASVVGPTLGGFLTDTISWRAIFYMNLPIGILALFVLWRYYPSKTAGGARRPVDYSGAALLGLTTVPLLLALVWAGNDFAWASPEIVGLFLLSGLSLIAFVWNESRVAEPIIPLMLFQSRFFAVATVLSFITGMGLFGAVNYMPMFVQGVLGTSAAASGFVTSPMMMTMVVASTTCGIWATRIGKYRPFIIAGSALITAGMALLTLLDTNSSVYLAVLPMIVIGLGIGSSMPIVNLVLQNSVSHQMLGVVSSSAQFFRQIGGTLGVAVFGTLVTNQLQASLDRELGQDVIAQTPPNLIATLEEPRTLLSPDALERLETGFLALGGDGAQLYERAVEAMRLAMADAVGLVFIASVGVTAVGFFVSFFMPEPSRPLRQSWSEEPDAASAKASQGDAGRLEGEPIS